MNWSWFVKAAKWLLAATWAGIVAVYIVPWITAYLTELGAFDRPSEQVRTLLAALTALKKYVEEPTIALRLVAALAGISGFALGYWWRLLFSPRYRSSRELADSIPIASSPSPSPNPVPSTTREFINVTPKYLVELSHGRTSVQAERLIQPYLGKWLVVTGRIRDVDSSSDPRFVYVTIADSDDTSVSLRFPPDMLPRLELLPPDHEITAQGAIYRLTEFSVRMECGELLSDRAVPLEKVAEPNSVRSE